MDVNLPDIPAAGFGPVAVIGAGTMGRDILALLAAAGLDVALLCRDGDEAEARKAELRKKLSRWEAVGARVNVTHLLAASEAIARAGLLIEAVPEDAALKREVLGAVAPHLAPGALVATNSSSIGPTELAIAAIDPARFLGMHFFYPARIKGVVELVRSARTSEETMCFARGFCDSFGLRALAMPEDHGFVLNRIFLDVQACAWDLHRRWNVALEALDAAAARIIPAGIFAFMDAVGLDTVLVAARNYAAMGHQAAPCGPLADELDRLVRSGRVGTGKGRGFLEYADGNGPGGRAGHIPPEPEKSIGDALDAAYVNAFCAAVDTGHFDAEELDGALRDYASCERGPLAVLRETGHATVVESLERLSGSGAGGYRIAEYLRARVRSSAGA